MLDAPPSATPYLDHDAMDIDSQNEADLDNPRRRPTYFYDFLEDLSGMSTDELDEDFPILPVFSEKVWPNKSYFQVAEKACRLASQLLCTVGAFTVIHTILDRYPYNDAAHPTFTRNVLSGDEASGIVDILYPHPEYANPSTARPRPQQWTSILATLAELSNHLTISFRPAETETDALYHQLTSGETHRNREPITINPPQNLPPYPLPGHGSHIALASRLHTPLLALQKQQLPVDPAAQLHHIWNLATTLLHEFGHALVMAARRNLDSQYEPFLGDSEVWAETGYALEKAVVGGVVSTMSAPDDKIRYVTNSPDGKDKVAVESLRGKIVVLVPLPDAELIHWYEANERGCPLREEYVRPEWDGVMRLPVAVLGRMMRKGFWKGMPELGDRTVERVGFQGGPWVWRRAIYEEDGGLRLDGDERGWIFTEGMPLGKLGL
ncbi:hypothetical protein MBLNU230_g0528t1 [Neophaeotheca triangularis]